jgi:DNA-binding NarL/FixJ family response regulator
MITGRKIGDIVGMRIILADDQPEVRSALRLLLEEKTGIKVIADASTSTELLRQVRACCPDLILLDWELPGSEPEKLVKLLHKTCSSLYIIALSSRPQMKPVALKAGVLHFICKSEPPEQLLAALDNCYNKLEGAV